MRLLNSEVEVEVIGINVIDTLVVLLIGLAIVTNHDCLHIGSTASIAPIHSAQSRPSSVVLMLAS